MNLGGLGPSDQWEILERNGHGHAFSFVKWPEMLPLYTMTHHKGHFTHEPQAVTMKLWEPQKKCPKAVPTHLYNHVVWSQTLKCSVKSYVTKPSIKYYINQFLFMRVLTHKNKLNQQLWAFRVPWSPTSFVLSLPPRGDFWEQSKWPWNMIQ